MNKKTKRILSKAHILATIFLVYGLMFFGAERAHAEKSWVRREPGEEPSLAWVGLAPSESGKYLAALPYTGKVHLSSDYGAHWVESGQNDSEWIAIAASSDGQSIAAIDTSGYFEITTDHGAHWFNPCINSCHGTGDWTSLAMSGDGQYLAATNLGGYQIWTSDHEGTNWVASQPNFDTWESIAYSPDGDTLVAASNSFGSGYIAVSLDHGENWNTGLNDSADWKAIAAGNDGKMVSAAGYRAPLNISKSNDNGETWQETSFGEEFNFRNNTLATSYDGKIIVAATEGYVYISTDSGSHFTKQKDPGGEGWFSVASSKDGKHIAIGGFEEIWTYTKPKRRGSSGSVGNNRVVSTPPLEVPQPVIEAAPEVIPTVNESSCPSIVSILKISSRGAEVSCLQKLLKIDSDGMFGPQTKATLVAFQKSKNLDADGIVGPATKKALGL